MAHQAEMRASGGKAEGEVLPVMTRELAGELQEWGVLVGLAMVLVGCGKPARRGLLLLPRVRQG